MFLDIQSVACYGRILGLLAVEGLDNLADKRVADDVLVGEEDGAYALEVLEEADSAQQS